MLDRYTSKLHIIDPAETSTNELETERNRHLSDPEGVEANRKKAKDKYHVHKSKMIPRIKEVFNMIFDDEKFKQMEDFKTRSKWDIHWVKDVPRVEKGESPYAVLRFAFLYNGVNFIEDIDYFDDELELWKAEALYMLLASEKNEIKPNKMGDEISKIFNKNAD